MCNLNGMYGLWGILKVCYALYDVLICVGADLSVNGVCHGVVCGVSMIGKNDVILEDINTRQNINITMLLVEEEPLFHLSYDTQHTETETEQFSMEEDDNLIHTSLIEQDNNTYTLIFSSYMAKLNQISEYRMSDSELDIFYNMFIDLIQRVDKKRESCIEECRQLLFLTCMNIVLKFEREISYDIRSLRNFSKELNVYGNVHEIVRDFEHIILSYINFDLSEYKNKNQNRN